MTLLAALACGAEDTAEPERPRFSDISVGDQIACALGLDGAVTCWGDQPQDLPVIPGFGWAKVVVGADSGCAVDQAGYACCWGVYGVEDCADGATLGPVAAVGAGGGVACALFPNGSLQCWGDARAESFTLLEAGSGVVDLLVGGGAAFGDWWASAVFLDGTVSTWGGSFYSSPAVFETGLIRRTIGSGAPPALQAGWSILATPTTGAVFSLSGEPSWDFEPGMVQARALPYGVCVLYPDGHVDCEPADEEDTWRLNAGDEPEPGLQFRSFDSWKCCADGFEAFQGNHCGVLFDGTISCWGDAEHPIFTEHP